ncbi:C40 family peptidase [Burkholderia ubonensis]|uniref:C40 family peptidase n=1 Tax=Burkholderia ubonensis TaxID=101571 RepID=UPI0009B4C4DF|nr:NlpC/P60 family protein [Burkholderia ubonensis]
MVTRQEIVDEARSWLGTRWCHQGRLKGVAVDCAGLVVCVARACGLEVRDVEGYSRRPDGSLLDIVRDQTLAVMPGHEDAGDVVIFQWNNDPYHLALLTGKNSIIHAYAVNRSVVEHNLDDRWRSVIVGFRRISGVE